LHFNLSPEKTDYLWKKQFIKAEKVIIKGKFLLIKPEMDGSSIKPSHW
jgi:hypothetical protein